MKVWDLLFEFYDGKAQCEVKGLTFKSQLSAKDSIGELDCRKDWRRNKRRLGSFMLLFFSFGINF